MAIKGTTTETRVDLEPIVEVTDRANEREERTTERTIERFTPVIQGWDLTPGESFGQHLIIDCEAPPPKPESESRQLLLNPIGPGQTMLDRELG